MWKPLLGLLDGPKEASVGTAVTWDPHKQEALRSCVSQCHWPQERLHRHGYVESPTCKQCGAAPGTLFHRRFRCDAGQVQRATCCSRLLLRCMDNLEAWHQDLDKAAAGLFPLVPELAPSPLVSSQAGVFWVNRPADGGLSGNIFPDGSALDPSNPLLSRAGWGLAMVDDNGFFIAGCYGAVPWEMAPWQASRDGEDYAMYMAALGCVTGPATYHVDCAATVSAARSPKFAVSAACSRAHLWTRFFHVHDGESPPVVKVKAHSSWVDVERGLSTPFHKRGSDEADKLAKLGARCHPSTAHAALKLRVVESVARQAARWAGEHEAWRADKGLRDCDDLSGPDGVGQGRARPQQQALPSIRSGARPFVLTDPQHDELVALTNMLGHSLRKATVFGPDGERVVGGGTVLICTKCGGYSWGAVKSLSRPCAPPTVALARQLSRVQTSVFPSWAPQYKGWTIGPMRSATPADVAILATTSSADLQTLGGGSWGSWSPSSWGERWSEAECAARFGLTPEDLAEEAERLRREDEESKEVQRAARRARR